MSVDDSGECFTDAGTVSGDGAGGVDRIRWIAQLGGFMGRKRDGKPGVKTIWQGLRRLHDIAETWRLATSNSTSLVTSEHLKKDAING